MGTLSTILRRVSNWRGSRVCVPEEHSPLNLGKSDETRASGVGRALLAGEQVGEYVIVRQLGAGGFGTVYEAAHPLIGKRAAVKVLHAPYSADDAVTARFVAEARAVNQIRHKNIVDIFSFGDLPDGRHYYVMELLEGVALDAYLDRVGALPEKVALPILHAIAKAITAAHEAGIAHRDLKPENVFLELDSEGLVHPKILDFGMAKLLNLGSVATHKTQSGAPMGSPRYMSPEQCRGVAVDNRTDVYAFGCMAYRMLTGHLPFEASTALELMMAHVSAPPPPPSALNAELGTEFDEPLLRLLEKQPEARPQTLLDGYARIAKAYEARGNRVDDSGIRLAEPFREMMRDRVASPVTPSPRQPPPESKRPKVTQLLSVYRKAFWGLLVAVTVLLPLAYLTMNRASRPTDARAPGPKPGSSSVEGASKDPLAIGQPQRDAAPAWGTETSDTASASPASSATIARVTLTVTSHPPGAEVFLEGQRLGHAPGSFEVTRGERAVTLELRAPGYVTAAARIVPSENLTQTLTLARKPRRASAAKTPGDLEDPY